MNRHVQRNLVETKMLGKITKNDFGGFIAKLVGGLEEGERVNPLEATDRNLLAIK
jgi:hypothetical protein